MSTNKISTESSSEAFEYVLGTLNFEERLVFEDQLKRDHNLVDEVHFWEKYLEVQTAIEVDVAPDPQSLEKIKSRINQTSHDVKTHSPKLGSIMDMLFPWKVATVSLFAAFVLVLVTTVQWNDEALGPNTDYVAVLLNEGNQPVLTALTASEGQKLHLKWDDFQKPQNGSLQLWSKSRRDGQIRPLFVFDEQQTSINLDQATLRLIQDSSHLLITLEEVGGSPFDEPSETVIAEGVCVRFSQPDEVS
ncbi:anti-sigma factor [Agaribacter flavus]|uniref:Anti-sigma factor domain-containing protein n=1 Tax=Agaribacter flavus TaxID=1902781 RepID=A0ABV7FQN3_9ALTE